MAKRAGAGCTCCLLFRSRLWGVGQRDGGIESVAVARISGVWAQAAPAISRSASVRAHSMAGRKFVMVRESSIRKGVPTIQGKDHVGNADSVTSNAIESAGGNREVLRTWRSWPRGLAGEGSKLKKRAAIAEAVRRVATESAAEAGRFCLYLAGQPFAEADPRKLNAGGAILSRVLKEIADASDAALNMAYRRAWRSWRSGVRSSRCVGAGTEHVRAR